MDAVYGLNGSVEDRMPKVSFLGQSHSFSSSATDFWIALAFFSRLVSRHALLD